MKSVTAICRRKFLNDSSTSEKTVETTERRTGLFLFALNQHSVCERTSGLCARSRDAAWDLLTHLPITFGSAPHNRPHRVSKTLVFEDLKPGERDPIGRGHLVLQGRRRVFR